MFVFYLLFASFDSISSDYVSILLAILTKDYYFQFEAFLVAKSVDVDISKRKKTVPHKLYEMGTSSPLSMLRYLGYYGTSCRTKTFRTPTCSLIQHIIIITHTLFVGSSPQIIIACSKITHIL